jgi:hypothetical protein
MNSAAKISTRSLTSTSIMLGDLSPARLRAIFASPDSCIAASASPPGRSVEVDGGYHVSGRFAWGSGIHQARWIVANCLFSMEIRWENRTPAAQSRSAS